MTSFYVRVDLACGARGLYFERGRCVETAVELGAFRELEWPVVRRRLQRQGLAYRVFVSPRDARCAGPGLDPATSTGGDEAQQQVATQLRCEQRLMSWGR